MTEDEEGTGEDEGHAPMLTTAASDCPYCGSRLEQKGWESMYPEFATYWVKCHACGYENKSNKYETIVRLPSFPRMIDIDLNVEV